MPLTPTEFAQLTEFTDLAAGKLKRQKEWLTAEIAKAEAAGDKARVLELKRHLQRNSIDSYDLGVRSDLD